MLLQIHDELIFEVPKGDEKTMIKIIKEEMMSVAKSDYHSFSTPLTVDVNVGDNWKKFSNISIRVSLDASGERAEYLRSGTDWKLIEDNFRYVKENLPHVNMGISSVFQLTNALHLPDFYQGFLDSGILDIKDLNNVFVIPLTGPAQLSSRILPKELKLKVEEKWEKFLSILPDNINLKGYVDTCIGYMNEEDLYESNKSDFVVFTTYLDKIRNENFGEVFPELKDYYEKVL